MKKLLLSTFLAVSLVFAPLCQLLPWQKDGNAYAAKVLYSNGQSTLSGTINSAVTTVVVASAAGFPVIAGGSGDWFVIKIDSEWMKVTATSGTTFTVVRAWEGSSAASHTSGATVTPVLSAAMLDQLKLDANIIGITGNTGASYLGSTYTLTSSYADSGLSVVLPSAGTYELTGHAQCLLLRSGANTVGCSVKLYNSTDAADVTNSAIQVGFVDSTYTANSQYPAAPLPPVFVTVAATKTIKMYALYSGTSPTTHDLVGASIMFKRLY